MRFAQRSRGRALTDCAARRGEVNRWQTTWELEQTYVLGNHPEELARLDRQAQAIERPTRLLLQAAGLTKGMRVLDLGSGLGHVARLAGDLVGPIGSVTGIDQSHDVLTVARDRTSGGHDSDDFVDGDVTTWRSVEPFDAVVGRLLLFHVADPAAVARHHIGNLRRGGLFVAIDFDLGARAPTRPFASSMSGPPRRGGVSRGRRVAPNWREARGAAGRGGIYRVSTLGIQAYLPPSDPVGRRCSRASCAASLRRSSPRHRESRRTGARRRSSTAWQRPAVRPAA